MLIWKMVCVNSAKELHVDSFSRQLQSLESNLLQISKDAQELVWV